MPRKKPCPTCGEIPKRARGKTGKRRAAQVKPSPKPYIDTSWHEPFLAALAKCGNVSYACKCAMVERRLSYEHRERFPEFAAKWDEKCEEAIEGLEFAAHQRALTESDRLMELLLKAHKPEKYNPVQKVAPTTPDGARSYEPLTDDERATRVLAILACAKAGGTGSDSSGS